MQINVGAQIKMLKPLGIILLVLALTEVFLKSVIQLKVVEIYLFDSFLVFILASLGFSTILMYFYLPVESSNSILTLILLGVSPLVIAWFLLPTSYTSQYLISANSLNDIISCSRSFFEKKGVEHDFIEDKDRKVFKLANEESHVMVEEFVKEANYFLLTVNVKGSEKLCNELVKFIKSDLSNLTTVNLMYSLSLDLLLTIGGIYILIS